MNFNFEDPFFLLMLIKLPKFIYDFYYVIKKINFNHCFISALIILLIGLIQDIDKSSFLYIYILKKYNYLYKKEHKIIYRLFLSLLYTFCFYNFYNIAFLKYIFINAVGYFLSSSISLYIQIKYEDNINDIYYIPDNISNTSYSLNFNNQTINKIAQIYQYEIFINFHWKTH
jgi:hypothetical protein